MNTPLESDSLTPTTTALYVPEAPAVWFSDTAWAKLWMLVKLCKKEVGWFGLVDIANSDYIVTDIFVPEQTVTSAETDIAPEALGALATELEAQGLDSSKLRYWGHSHVNMAVRPSGTDEDQIEEYLDNVDFFIRGIHNKRGDSKIDVYDVEYNFIYQCVQTGLQPMALSLEEQRTFVEQITLNVQERQYSWSKGKGNSKSKSKSKGNSKSKSKSKGAIMLPSNAAIDDDYDDLDEYALEGYYGGGYGDGLQDFN